MNLTMNCSMGSQHWCDACPGYFTRDLPVRETVRCEHDCDHPRLNGRNPNDLTQARRPARDRRRPTHFSLR